jgi:hypothetical protein
MGIADEAVFAGHGHAVRTIREQAWPAPNE